VIHTTRGSHHRSFPIESPDTICNDDRVITTPIDQLLAQATEGSLLIVLRPIDDVVPLDREILRKFDMWMYGSYNVRCMLQRHGVKAVESFINDCFRSVLFFEAFTAMGSVTACPTSTPHLFSALRMPHNAAWWQFLRIASKLWDRDIAASNQADIQMLEARTSLTQREAAKLKRSRTILARVRQGLDDPEWCQVMMADPGLLAVVVDGDSTQPRLATRPLGGVSFDPQTGYSSYSEGVGRVRVPVPATIADYDAVLGDFLSKV
jgi:hypothetical protein